MHMQKMRSSLATGKDCAKIKDLFQLEMNSSQLVVHSQCIPYIPELGERVGVYAAILLQQLHYWIQKDFGQKKEGKIWIYNSYDAWAKQLRCSISNIRKVVARLKETSLIETKVFRARYGDTTKWYTINYDALKELGFILASEYNFSGKKGISLDSAQHFKFSHLKIPSTLNQNKQVSKNSKDKESLSLQNTLVNPHRVSQSNTPLNKINKIINNLSSTEVGHDYLNMISIWNEVVHQGSKAIKLTERRLKWLKRRFELEFQSCLEKWKAYCELIASNDFLMGLGKKGWKATFDWALMPHNIQKVLSNVYSYWTRKKGEGEEDRESKGMYSGNKINAESPILSKAEIKAKIQESMEKIENSTYPQFWKEISKEFIVTFGVGKYESWISQLVPNFTQENKLILNAPSRFIADWVEKNYSQAILRICDQLKLDVRWVDFAHVEAKGSVNPEEEQSIIDTKVRHLTQATVKQIESSNYPEFWKEVCKNLISKLDIGRFKSWIPQLRYEAKYSNTLVLKARSKHSIIWIKRNFADHILECCQKLDPKIQFLEFLCE